MTLIMLCVQLNITDDGFLNLMSDDGEEKDDVKLPDNEVGQKITKLFTEEEKDTSTYFLWHITCEEKLTNTQTSSFSPPWVRRPPLTPRRLPRARPKFLNHLERGCIAAHAAGVQSIPSAGAISEMLQQHGLRLPCGHAF